MDTRRKESRLSHVTNDEAVLFPHEDHGANILKIGEFGLIPGRFQILDSSRDNYRFLGQRTASQLVQLSWRYGKLYEPSLGSKNESLSKESPPATHLSLGSR